MNEERLIQLEEKLAHQEHMVHGLNEVICHQQKQIDQLESLCEHLIEKVKSIPEMGAASHAEDEVPPHY